MNNEEFLSTIAPPPTPSRDVFVVWNGTLPAIVDVYIARNIDIKKVVQVAMEIGDIGMSLDTLRLPLSLIPTCTESDVGIMLDWLTEQIQQHCKL